MNCPNCHQVTETGAVFCGNCGQALRSTAALPLAPAATSSSSLPSYAIAVPSQHSQENKATLALLFGVTGIIGLLFIPLIGLAFGTAGIVMATMSRAGAKRGLSTAGLALSSLAVLVGLAAWTYAVKQDPLLSKTASRTASHGITAPAVPASDLSTPCYTIGFANKLSIANDTDSCDMNAFNGSALDTSTEMYKIYADQSQIANAQDLTSVAKPALEKDLRTNLPGLAINSEQAGQFAGSPAYLVGGFDSKLGVAIVEAVVLHQVSDGKNTFVLVHVIDSKTADLDMLEAQWQWK